MLATKLRKARLKVDLSMSQVSRLSEKISKRYGYGPRGVITQGYISRLESGQEDNPSYLKLKMLGKAYRVKVGEWF